MGFAVNLSHLTKQLIRYFEILVLRGVGAMPCRGLLLYYLLLSS